MQGRACELEEADSATSSCIKTCWIYGSVYATSNLAHFITAMPRSDRHETKSRRNPPPNYSNRREQLRLFLIVGGVFLVIIVVQQARQPEKWRWLTGQTPLGGEADLDTRVRTIDEGGNADVPGTIVATNLHFRPDADLDDEARAQRRAEKDIWKQQLESLGWTQRRNVARVLKGVRENKPLSAEHAVEWKEILGLLDERWVTHIDAAREAVSTDQRLSDEDKASWLLILHELQKRWGDGLKDALTAAAEPATLSETQRKELQRFQEMYDEMAIDEIRDDTVISRPNEVNAWFRLLENLRNSSADELAQLDEQAAPEVGFRQLHQQPQDYRGRLVRIRGGARMAYHVDAPPNIVGVEGYYVFVLMPAGGPNSPIMVYALDLPPGFPEIKDKDADGGMTELNEDVEFTGYFIKRMAYLAQDGTRVAPLLIAKSPVWTPRVVRADPTLPDWWTFLAVAGGLALFSVGVALFVYWRSRKSPAEAYSPAARATPEQFAALANERVLSPGEALAEMARRQTAPSDDHR